MVTDMKYIKEEGEGTIRISDHVGDKIIVSFLFLSGLVYSWAFIHGIYGSFYDYFYNNLGFSDITGVLFCMVLGLVFFVFTLLMFYKLLTKFEVVFDKNKSKVIVKTKSIIKCLESTRTINIADIKKIEILHTTDQESDYWSISLITNQEEYIHIYDEVESEVKKLANDISKLTEKSISYS